MTGHIEPGERRVGLKRLFSSTTCKNHQIQARVSLGDGRRLSELSALPPDGGFTEDPLPALGLLISRHFADKNKNSISFLREMTVSPFQLGQREHSEYITGRKWDFLAI